MDDDMLADQRRLVELVEEEGWKITDLELSAYDSPWADENDPEATVTITARKPYERDDDEGEGGGGDGGESDGDNPYRVK